MSGAANCPETPRQKMIGMMYLVLTAMLALNVSTEVLEGFSLVDKSLHTTIDASDKRNAGMYDDFQYLYEQNPEKVKEWLDKANEVKAKSDSLYNYIQNFKYEMVRLSDKDKTTPDVMVGEIEGKSNTDVNAQYAILEGNGKILREKIEAYKNYLIELAENDSVKQSMYKSVFETADGELHSGVLVKWESTVFEHQPLAASVTVLTKFQSDIRSSEAEIVQYLKGQTDALDFRVNKIDALIIPNSKYIIKGGKYSSKVVLSAVDSTKTPKFFIEGRELASDGLYEVPCPKTGTFTYAGFIEMQKGDGSVQKYPFESDYVVGEPSVTIANKDLNVVYEGFKNNFSVSVPGIAHKDLKVSATGAKVTANKDGWIIVPTGNSKVITIKVSAEIEGKLQSMGSSQYRVKPLPRPTAYLNSSDRLFSEGTIPRSALIGGKSFLEASYGPDGLLNLDFKIVGFNLMTDYGISETKGNKFSAKQLSQLKQLKKGSLVNIVNIRAVGPDGKQQRLNAIPLSMQ